MIDPSSPISGDTLISIGTSIVVIVAAIKATMVLTNIRRDLDEIRSGLLKRAEFELWTARFARDNPAIKVPDLVEDHT